MAEEEQVQAISKPELLVDNNVPPDITPKDGEQANAESKSEYCMIALLMNVRVKVH